MIRKLLLASLVALSVAGEPAAAEGVQDAIVAQLAEQGFTKIYISRTFLGRVRVLATSPEQKREIIFNPRTGEILRDYWDDLDANGLSSTRIVSPFGRSRDDRPSSTSGGTSGHGGSAGGSSGSGSGGDDDSSDDSGDDDREDDSSDDSSDDDGHDREDDSKDDDDSEDDHDAEDDD